MFPGGGIYFYWQIGVASYLRDERPYDLSSTSFAGASAGALSATLTLTGVDFERATETALRLAEEGGVWDRSSGLQGIWGAMIEDWLNELLPENAADMVEDRLALLVTPVPFFGKRRITSFTSKEDLIQCNMASVHLPWFLDGELTRTFRNEAHVDGSFFARPADYLADDAGDESVVLTLDYNDDPVISSRGLDFVSTKPKEAIWKLIDDGRAYAAKLEARGGFESLPMLVT